MDAFAATVRAYRWYDGDAGETASTPRQDENTGDDADVTSGNVSVQLRVSIQESGSGSISGASTDDWTVRYRKNGTGGYAAVPASSGGVGVQVATAGLTNDGACTNRSTNGISDGTGTFVTGEQSTDGTVDDWQLTADNFGELVFGLEFVQADLLDTDSFEFDISLNGGNPGTTMSVSPTMSITKSGTTHQLTGTAAMSLDATATGNIKRALTGSAAMSLDATAVGTRVVFLTTQLTDP